MPKPRFSGGKTPIRVSSSQMPPPESGCRPAMQLSAVDLPHPDGPSNAMNSPRWMSRSRPCSAATGWPSAFVKLRLTESRRNCSKRGFMAIPVDQSKSFAWDQSNALKRELWPTAKALTLVPCRSVVGGRPATRSQLLGFLRTDIPVPLLERSHHRRGIQRQHVRMRSQHLRIFRTAVLLQHVLTMRRRLIDGDTLDGRSRIEIAVVIGQRLLRRFQHEIHQLVEHVEFLFR